MAGQNADMTLKVGLDLNFFKQELLKATSSLAGQPIDINIRFQKKSIADQYRLLSRYLGGKKAFDVKIESNTLNALADKVANFQKTLTALKNEKIELSINASANVEKFSKEKVRKIRAQIYRDIVSGGAGEIQLPTKLATPKTAAFIKELSRQAQVTIGIKNGATGKEARSVLDAIQARIQSDQKIKQGGGKLRIPTSIKASINNADVSEFKKIVNEKLGNIAIKIKAEVDIAKTPSQIQAEVARKMEDIARIGAERMAGGGVTEAARREQFRAAITGEGIGSLKNIAKQIGVGGYSKYKSDTATELINKLVQEASIEAITKYLDPQAMMRNPDRSGLNKVLDTFARGLFQMLGMDPATIRREMAQRRALPGVNFPATIPQRNIPIGPSGTGRALPPGASAAGLIGGARPPAGLLPSITAQSSIRTGVEALFAAGGPQFPTGPSGKLAMSAGVLQARVDQILSDYFKVAEVTIKEIFNPQDLKRALNIFSYLPQALRDAESRTRQARVGIPSAQGIAGLLPAAAVGRAPSTYATGPIGGETRVEMIARREREARMRSDLRGIDVMGGGAGRTPSPYSQAYRSARSLSAIVPYAAGGAIVPQPSMAGGGAIPPGGGGGRGGMGGFGGFGRALGGVPNLPGAGTIRELGSEFGFATKQVLLFGQAYKLLGFLQDFPSQVAAAVSSLQSFKNTLSAISPTAKEAQLSNELILALVEKYNIPLESARQGFTKLYASMQPAGFSGAEISKLFTGISKASATLGLSSDKVDRVTYAFSQMASKGQLMSEEVSGQLGDVIPGALSIMAEAAGMGIGEFKKAMENGEFVGARFTEVMNKVPEVLEKRFGKGAEGAAKTFQGAMNNMQTSVKLFYESFEPAAVAFLNMFVTPISSQLKDLADGFTAFFSKTQAQTIGGQAIATELENLRPALQGVLENIKAFGPSLRILGDAALGMVKIFTAIAGNPIVGFFARAYVQVLLLTTAFKLFVGTALVQTIRSLVAMVAQLVTTRQVMLSTQLQMALLTSNAGALTSAFNSGALAVAGLGAAIKTALLGGVITAAILIIDQLINRIQALRAESEAVKARGKGARAEVKAAYAGGVESGRSMAAQKEAEARSASRLSGIYRDLAEGKKISAEDYAFYEEQGADVSLLSKPKAGATRKFKELRAEFERLSLRAAETAESLRAGIAKGAREGEEYAAAQASRTAKEQRKLEEDLTKDKKGNADKLANQQQQAAIDAASRQNALDNARFDHLLKMSENEFEQWKSLQDAKYDYEIAGLNSIEARQFKFQRDLQQIEINRIETVRKAAQAVAQAQQEVMTTQRTAAAAGGATGLLQGSTGISSGPHFDVRRADGGAISETEARALFSEEVRRTLTMTSPYGPRVAPVPGASSFHQGVDLAGPANTPLNLAPGYSLQGVAQEGGLGYTARVSGPTGEMYKVGHIQPPGASYTRQRRSEKAGGKEEEAQLQASLRTTEMLAIAQDGYTLALAKTDALIKQNITTIFPVAELQLETSLLKMRNQLQMQGMPAEYIQYMQDSFKAEYEANRAKEVHNTTIAEYEGKIADLQDKQAKGIKLTSEETAYLKYAEEQIRKNKDALATLTEQQKEYQIAQLESAIATMKNADAMKAMEEVSNRINQAVEGVTGSYKDMFKEIAKGGDSVEVLKKLQDSLADQALTMFFDFAMQPVEKFFKDQLGAIFGVPDEEAKRQEQLTAMEKQLAELKTARETQQKIDKNVEKIANVGEGATQSAPASIPGVSSPLALPGATGGLSSFIAGQSGSGISYAGAAPATGTGMGSIGSYDWSTATENLDAATKSVAETVNETAKKTDEANVNWQEALGKTVQGIGIAAGSIMGIMAGIKQIEEGGTSNVLGGIGSVLLSVGGAIGGFANMFKPTAAANGAVWNGGFRAFANGGMVTGPTLGLIGEGRYNEAIVPLPDGKSIPVQMRGQQSSRDLLSNGATNQQSSPVLSMSFQTTKFGDREYVDVAQLQAAMAETRKMAARDGANRGASLALDKLQNSPSARRKVGMR